MLDPQLLHLSVLVMAPFALAALGELLMERAGVLNVAIEGMMAIGASLGFLAAFRSGSVLEGLAVAAAAGAAIALLLGLFAITLRSDQITIGLVLLVLSVGLASLVYRAVIGISLEAPLVAVLQDIPIPVLASIPVLGVMLFDQNLIVYATYLLVPALWILLFQTQLGLRIRACGDNPRAADSLGVRVVPIRYATTLVGGMLIGLAGAYLPLAITGGYQDGIVGGRGWIALMLVIFGRWQPPLVVVGCLLFAYVEALQFKLAGILKVLPPQALGSLPYVLAIVGLVSVYRNARAPAALGLPFDREQRT